MKKNILLIGAIIVFVFGGLVVKANLNSDSYEKVTYHGRKYYVSNSSNNPSQMDFDVMKEAKPTGELVNGLEVYEKGYVQTPTLLYLKQKDGKFLVYELSGGP